MNNSARGSFARFGLCGFFVLAFVSWPQSLHAATLQCWVGEIRNSFDNVVTVLPQSYPDKGSIKSAAATLALEVTPTVGCSGPVSAEFTDAGCIGNNCEGPNFVDLQIFVTDAEGRPCGVFTSNLRNALGVLPEHPLCNLQKEKDNGPPKECGIGNPCNPANGNKYQAETDFQGKDGIIPFARSYSSQTANDSGLGFGWSSSIVKRLDTAPTANGILVQIRSGDGRGEPFTCPSSTGVCSGSADTTLALTKDTSGYTLTRRNSVSERYDTSGRLLNETDTNARTTTYTYNASGQLIALTGPFGHAISFAYSGTHISSVTDPSGAVYGYTYDANNNLTQVS